MKKILSLNLVLLLCICTSAWAQERTVSGAVTDQDGLPMPGVTVIEKGTNNGTITDIDGNYKLTVGDDATLVFSYVGFKGAEVPVEGQSTIDMQMSVDVTQLSEVVVVGYGTQEKKEITSAVTTLNPEEFNRGNINNPAQLLQGKVPGLSIYNKGGDPNSNPTIRLRGISTVGANTEPLVVIDGVIGASLDNVDPNDIESVNVLKDGSAAAIYGSRGSSGVILVTTKSGTRGKVTATYNGYASAASVYNNQPNMSASQYIAAGGNDLGAVTDWQDEVTRTGISNVHNLAVSGGTETTVFRLSTNFRNVNGILKESGFEQVNARASINHSAIDDRLRVAFNMALTNRESNFSFNEALRYAVLYNPTAPVRFDNGEFFQAILFDNFNPVAIIEQNQNVGTNKDLNYNAKIDFDVTDHITLTANYGQQYETALNGEFYPSTSFFRGLNRTGLARRYSSENRFDLFEAYGSYINSFGDIDLNFTAGYSWQETQFQDMFIEAGNFPSDVLGFNDLSLSGDRAKGIPADIVIDSYKSPEERIIAFFGRVNLTFDNAIFFNASLRQEGSTKLGENNQWGLFPALGLGVDIINYIEIPSVNLLKLRVGYGVTGSLPAQSGLAQDLYGYSFDDGGIVFKIRDANPDLQWEEKSEINLGIDFGVNNKLTGSIDLYTRSIDNFILEREVPTDLYPSGTRFENVGELRTDGIEVALNYRSFSSGDFSYSPGIVFSSYSTTLESFIEGQEINTRANLGSPGQNSTEMIRVAVGEGVGQIWGPVFSGQVDEDGAPIMTDLNGDGLLITDQGSALLPEGDFAELGNGIPDFEIGWTNEITFKNWDLNAFFRGAFGHSLVNTYRAFYEPIDPGAINSYNRVITDKAVEGLQVSQFSSLYVEKADFFRLDNLSLGYNFMLSEGTAVRNVRLYATAENVFVITGYTGIDPDPVLQDFGPTDNGGFLNTTPDVLSPGIDRRNNYFTARTFTLGINIGL
ncbi:MAG: SusC/RagA family TonB-linked outer membrane protein [Candidatus Cyclobacteriaceae bacterium M2_1C_046]